MNEKDASIELIGLFDSEGHLTPSTLAALCCGSLCDEASLAVLTHIGECTDCANDYAAVLEQGLLYEPPAGFAERLQTAIEAEEPLIMVPVLEQADDNTDIAVPPSLIPKTENTGKKAKSGGSFFSYAFRVAIAASIALVVTFSGFAIGGANKAAPVKAPGFSFVDSVTNQLKDFSQSVLNREVFHHAEAKK